ncbi:helix-turn-helix domain-containing protein [Paenibacillus dokdonensis]|uniref:helix-turn-helix domain-containing protein n=1 Tax=Paenibacillus dokdonensis TaxID=2567944 RepID=UPI0010A77F4C|nr:helix-turn-helix transcriptional regulator [Paenibacillus dokdonensis]
MQSLGERIKHLREKRNITQKDLAVKTGLTVVQLSRYETNDRKPDPDSLKMLADVLETTGDYLLGRTNDPSTPHEIDPNDLAEFEEFINNPYHNVFFKDFLEAPEERKKELLQFWRFIKEAEKDRKPGDRQGE